MTDTVLFFSRQFSQRTTELRDEEHGVISKSLRTCAPSAMTPTSVPVATEYLPPASPIAATVMKPGSPRWPAARHPAPLNQLPTIVFVGGAFSCIAGRKDAGPSTQRINFQPVSSATDRRPVTACDLSCLFNGVGFTGQPSSSTSGAVGKSARVRMRIPRSPSRAASS